MKRKMIKEPTIFSYVVDHDTGFAPNPSNGYCTLVHCKFGGTTGRRNIVELAEVGDWVIGTGGKGKDSAGHDRIVYLMKITEKLPFNQFLSDRRFLGRSDCVDFGTGNLFALISRQFFYFGVNALPIAELSKDLAKDLSKAGPGFRRDYSAERLSRLVAWFQKIYRNGIHGNSCSEKSNTLKIRRRLACG